MTTVLCPSGHESPFREPEAELVGKRYFCHWCQRVLEITPGLGTADVRQQWLDELGRGRSV